MCQPRALLLGICLTICVSYAFPFDNCPTLPQRRSKAPAVIIPKVPGDIRITSDFDIKNSVWAPRLKQADAKYFLDTCKVFERGFKCDWKLVATRRRQALYVAPAQLSLSSQPRTPPSRSACR